MVLRTVTRFFIWILIVFISDTAFAKVEKIEYRGWKNCYQISNGISKVIIVPESGGRVVAFTYKDKNIIYQDKGQDGLLFSDWKKKHFDPDGGRLDYGP